MRYWTVLALALLAFLLPARATQQRLSTLANIQDYQVDGDTVTLDLWGAPLHFRFHKSQVADADALLLAFADAKNAGRFLTVRYDLDEGRLGADDVPAFAIREIVYDGRTISGEPRTTAVPAPATPEEAARTSLARGAALYAASDYEGAQAEIANAMAGNSLTSRQVRRGLYVDASAKEEEAQTVTPAGPKRDSLFLGALSDYRTLAMRSNIARSYQYLGDYDEAAAIMKVEIAATPDAPWNYVTLGAIYRSQGRYEDALGELDELLKNRPEWKVMPYYYHRGWTLRLMGRPEEAVASFTEGLKVQPDYAWAFIQRACANADLGHLQDALSDQQQALTLIRQNADAQMATPQMDFDVARGAKIADLLRSAMAKDPHAKATGLCETYWDIGEQHRERSAALPQP